MADRLRGGINPHERNPRRGRQETSRKLPFYRQPAYGVAGALLLFFTAFGVAKVLDNSQTKTLDPEQATQLIGDHYSEMRLSDLRGSGEFTTARANNRWLNFSELRIKPSIAEQAIKHLEELGAQEEQIPMIHLGEILPVKAALRNVDNRNFLIGGEKLPSPSWANPSGETRFKLGDGHKPWAKMPDGSTYIKGYQNREFTNLNESRREFEENPTTTFLVQACNSVVEVARLDAKRYDFVDKYAQVGYCDSLGRAMSAKAFKMPFEKYQVFVEDSQPAVLDAQTGATLKLMLYPKDRYEKIPLKEPVFK